MGISEFYGTTDSSRARESLDTALELGVTYFDTADIYGNGSNEEFLSAFMRTNREQVLIGIKFGIVRNSRDPTYRGVDNSEEHIRRSVENSLRRLRTDCIDIYFMHRKDPHVPISDTVGVLSNLVSEGKIREIGLSEVTADEIRAAHRVHPIGAVQIEWSLFTRDAECRVIPQARELGIAVVAYAPLSRGLLIDTSSALIGTSAGDLRRSMPRFAGKNFEHNRDLIEPLRRVAARRGLSSAQVALAWLHSRASVYSVSVIPIPGTRSPKRVVENVEAANIELTIEEADPLAPLYSTVAGDRYPDLSFTYLEREARDGHPESEPHPHP